MFARRRSAKFAVAEKEDEEEEDEPNSSIDNTTEASSSSSPVSQLLADPIVAQMVTILDIDLEINVEKAFAYFWAEEEDTTTTTPGRGFYEKYMLAMKDIQIDIGHWNKQHPIGGDERNRLDQGFIASTETFDMYRQVLHKHPPKISFPGLPRYAKCNRIQRCFKRSDKFVISDLLRMTDIPYSDCFNIETRWVFSQDGKNMCHVEVGIQVHFLKSTWFKGQIVSSTTNESRESLEIWTRHAVELLNQRRVRLRRQSKATAGDEEGKKVPLAVQEDQVVSTATPPPTFTIQPFFEEWKLLLLLLVLFSTLVYNCMELRTIRMELQLYREELLIKLDR